MASSNRDEITRLELLHAAHPDGLVFPHLADAYRRAGRFSQAESVLDTGLRHHSEYSSAHVVLGRLRLDQGKPREAETAFRRVLQLDPQNQVAVEYLAELAAGEGRLDEALAHYRRLTRLGTDDDLAARVSEIEERLAQQRVGPRGLTGANNGRADVEGAAVGGAAGGAGASGDSAGAATEPGEVVTETMAELYARQGLYDRAARVYRQLLSRHGGDVRLRARLEEAERRMSESGASAEAVENATVAGGEREAEPSAGPATAAGTPARRYAPPGTGPRRRTGRSAPGLEPSIRDQLQGLVGWRPEGGAAPEAPRDLPPGSPSPDDTRVRPSQAEEVLGGRWSRSRLTAPPPASAPSPPPAAAPAAPAAPDGPDGPDGSSAPARSSAPAARSPARAPSAAGAGEMETGAAEVLRGVSPQTRSLIALTDMLVGLLEYRDPFFRGSSSLTRLLATSVAEEMGLDAAQQVDLALAAVLRDVGRLALGGRLVPDIKMSGTPQFRRRIERHVDLALSLMEGIELSTPVRQAVRHHHERWDGAGYPDALAGEDIPLLARILAAVDSFAAMVSPRPYRVPRKVAEAAGELQAEAGTQYDPEVVNALMRVLARREQPHLGFVQRHHILIVDPDQPGALVTAAKLCSAGYLAEVSVDPDTARERLRRVPVAALVLSAESGAGVETVAAFIRDVRIDPMFASLPIVVVDAEDVDLRVRLLESGADVCFPSELSYAELQGTLGALVRRALRSRPAAGSGEAGDAPWLALQGDIQDFPLTWLLQVMKYDSRTAAIGIRTREAEGAIYLRQGDAVHAQVRGGDKGEPALREMLQWRKGRFTVQPDAKPKERSIDTSIMHLLLMQAVEEDHANAGIFGAVSPED